jgi:cobalt-zinc-cadmium resistance protein CzcA
VENRVAIGALTVLLIVAGVWSMNKVPIDAVPDITNNQVQIITQAPNLATVDIEQFVTYPVELEMSNLPGVKEIRSVSRFGLSVVTVVFDDDMGTYLPRQLVQEKLEKVRDKIPKQFGSPDMGPISTGLGEIYQYSLEVDSSMKGKYSLAELRSFQDWIVNRQMAMVDGVVEVNSFGGKIKQYEIAIEPEKLKAMSITISDVFEALKKNNENTGGAYIVKSHLANYIRGEGLIRNTKDIEKIRVATKDGIPILVGDIATVQIGSAVRYGAFTRNGEGEAVGGMVMLLKGANSNDVITAVKQRVDQIQSSLPKGVRIVPFLDRSVLIADTTNTVFTNLIEGGLIVIFVLVIFLGNWRGGLIVASTIPLSLLFAFIMMNTFDVWANLMSLGAIDFGIIVDGAVIIVEGTVFGITQKLKKSKEQLGKDEIKSIAKNLSKRMMNSAFFGQLIILIVFIPILTLEGIEGKMFKPMALTFGFAMLGAMLLCLTYVPMMSSSFLKSTNKVSFGDKIVHSLERLYSKVLDFVFRFSKSFIITLVALFGITIYLFSTLGGEFIPQLDEGDIAFHIILKPGSSIEESVKAATKVENLIMAEFPEIEQAMSKFGVSEVPTDPMPMDIGDCIVKLKSKDEWTSAETKDELIAKMKEVLETVPGLNYEFSQPIEMRFNELISGVRQDIAIKIFGEDLDLLASKAEEVQTLLSGMQGIGDMSVEATSGLSQITLEYDRAKLARYGIDISEANELLKTAFAGGKAGVIFEGEKRYDMVVRLNSDNRKSISDVKYLYINTPNGSQIPINEVAKVDYVEGPMQISRDNTNRRVYVGINVRDRDIESLMDEIKTKLDFELELPAGYYITYGGAFENLERAMSKLSIVIPLVLLLIFILIYFTLKSFKYTSLIFLAIPFASIGGILSLWSRGLPFSISAGVGFIVLFGVAVLNGLVLLNGLEELKEEQPNTDINERVKQGTMRRVRPILLTALTDVLGFFPMAISMTAGAEVQRPLATVVIGGLFTSTILTLFLLPILYRWMENYKMKKIPNIATAILIIGFVFVSSHSFVFAQNNSEQKKISMNEAIEIAKQNYPLMKISKLQIEKANKQQKKSINFGTTQIFTGVEERGNGSEGVQSIIGVSQNNIDIFGSFARGDYYSRNKELAEASMNLTELELEKIVARRWVGLNYAKSRYYFYYSLDTLLQGMNKYNDARYEADAVSGLEYSITKSNYIEIRNKLAQSEADVESASILLNQLLTDKETYTTTESKFELEELNQDAATLETHPMMQYQQKQIEISESNLDISYSKLYPKINGQYRLQNIQDQSGFYAYQVGVSVPLIFNSVSGDIGAAEQEVMITKEKYKMQMLELEAKYKAQLANYKKWRDSYNFYRSEVIPLAEEIRTKSYLRYKVGEIDYMDFVQGIEKVIKLEEEYLNSMNKYYEAYVNMKYYNSK